MEKNLPLFELILDDTEDKESGVFGSTLVESQGIDTGMFDDVTFVYFNKDGEVDDEKIEAEILEYLDKTGEVIDEKEWELYDFSNVEIGEENDVKGVYLSTYDSSEYDNDLFKIRFAYMPKSVDENSREFCKKMTSNDKVYRKEELVSSSLNPGFGPGGRKIYNIFLYKGGVHCKHRFVRRIYLKKNNREKSYFEALNELRKLKKDIRNNVKFKPIPEEVGQIANKENNYWRLAFSNEEKRHIYGPVLIPNQRIYRNFDGTPAEVTLSAATIEECEEKFFKMNYHHNSSIEHTDWVEGIHFFESWIIRDEVHDKSRALGYKDLPVGTWMLGGKIENDEAWEKIKKGEVKGFSIDGKFKLKKIN